MSCSICGAETATSIYRCALHRRPSFYSLRIDDERASSRGGVDAQLPGDHRPLAPRVGPPLRERVLAELVRVGRTGALGSEIRSALGTAEQSSVDYVLRELRRRGQAESTPTRSEAGQPALRWHVSPTGRLATAFVDSVAKRTRRALAEIGPSTVDELADRIGAPRAVVATACANEVRLGRAVKQGGGHRGKRLVFRLLGGAA